MVSSGGHAREQAPPLVHASQRLHQQVVRRHLDRVLAPDALPLDGQPARRPAEQAVDGVAARQPPDLGVDDAALAEVQLAARALAAHHQRDARLLVGGDGAQQIDERHVLDVADEAFVVVRRQLEPLAIASLQQRARTRDDFLHVDRTRDEIVGARLQSAALAVDAGIEHQHDGGRERVPLLRAPAEIEAVVGSSAADDHQVGAIGEALPALFGVARDAHGEARVPQAEIEDSARRFVALDDQDRLRPLPLYLLLLHAKVP